MKTICHITTTPQTHIPRLLKECSTAVKMGIKPYVVAQGKNFEKDGITHIGVPCTRNRITRFLYTRRYLMKEALKVKADIYQLHDPELLLYANKLKQKGKIVIFDSHEFYKIQIKEKDYIPANLRNLISYLYGIFEQKVCQKIDAIITVCTVDGEEYFKKANKLVYIANYVDHNIFGDIGNKIKINKKKAIYIGALSHSRGISHLVQATELAGITLILCGSFIPKEYHKEVESLSGYLNVEYKGNLKREEIIDLLSLGGIGVSTLLHVGQYAKVDTLATKIYEYMSMALPVVISDSDYARKIVFEYNIGILVQPDNVEEIASAIKYLINNPEIAHQMGENGRRAVEEKYNWEIEEKKLVKLYEDLLKDAVKK